jgi:TRAP-type C4-dicarboxylate transport system permease small subunit
MREGNGLPVSLVPLLALSKLLHGVLWHERQAQAIEQDRPDMHSAFSRASRWASLLALWFSGLGLLAMTAIIFWQVVARYGFNNSPAWSEQTALILMIWMVFFAGAAGVREGFHIRIVAVTNAVPPPLGRMMRLAAQLVIAGFGLALAIWGGELVMRTWDHTVPALGISRGLAYSPAPASGLLMMLFALEQMATIVHGREVEPAWN